MSDNGVGLDPTSLHTTATGGFGLFGIHERLAYLGGDLIVDSAPRQGTRAKLTLPFMCELPIGQAVAPADG